jgi:PAS domain S-box-containing protein
MVVKLTSAHQPPDLSSLCLAITEHAPLPMATVEGASHIVRYVNPAFCRLLDKPSEQLVGIPFREMLPEMDECVTLLDRVFHTGKPESHMEQEHSKHHPAFWSFTIWPVLADERPVGVMLQVTETAQFHEELLAMNEALMLGSLRQHELTESADALNVQLQSEIIERKRAEEALLKAAPLQNAIFNSVNFSSIATDAKGVIQIFNVGAERMLGYTAAEVMNKITPADISDPQELIARAEELSVELGTSITPGFEALVFKASRGIEDIYELTYIRKDGTRFPAVVNVTALRDAQDAIIGYLLIGTDNTARKEAKEALLQAGALQNAIFNSANFSSIATDAKGVIQIFNVGAERMLGYTAAEVMNKITPADISDPQEVIARAKTLSVELGTPITPGFEALVFKASREIEDIYELTYIRKDGTRFPAVVSVTALRDAQGAIIGYLLIGTDNTARKLVEAEQKKLDQRLRDQQFYTRSLIESNIDAIMTTDPSGIITDVNKQMEALTGCTHDELIGAPFKGFFTDPERAEAAIKLVLSEKKVNDYELTACARDGKQTVVSYNATTFYDRNRTLQGVFAAARDVTERKRVEVELQQANVAKSRFLAAASHDLRQPLQTLALLQGLLAKIVEGEQAQKLVTRLDETSGAILGMLNTLLDINQIDTGTVHAEMVSFPIDGLLSRLKDEFTYPAQAKGLAVRVVSCGLSIYSDPRLLEQMIRNLLANALKYTKRGRVLLGCRRREGMLSIEIWDTGIGIPGEELQAIFDEYHQLDNAARERSRGLGLGLSIVQRLGNLLGCPVRVRSQVGKGSVFTIEVMLPPSETGPAFESPQRGINDGIVEDVRRTGTILVVEDDPEVREFLKIFLKDEGHHTATVPDGVAALALADRGMVRPDLILTDYNLPNGLNGVQLTAKLRKKLHREIPVIILTGDMSTDTLRDIALQNCVPLNKPVKVKELTQAIQRLLPIA